MRPSVSAILALNLMLLSLIPSARADAFDEHVKRGEALAGRQDFAGAVREYEAAYRIRKEPEAALNIGLLSLKLKRADSALRFCELFLSDAAGDSEELRKRAADCANQARLLQASLKKASESKAPAPPRVGVPVQAPATAIRVPASPPQAPNLAPPQAPSLQSKPEAPADPAPRPVPSVSSPAPEGGVTPGAPTAAAENKKIPEPPAPVVHEQPAPPVTPPVRPPVPAPAPAPAADAQLRTLQPQLDPPQPASQSVPGKLGLADRPPAPGPQKPRRDRVLIGTTVGLTTAALVGLVLGLSLSGSKTPAVDPIGDIPLEYRRRVEF